MPCICHAYAIYLAMRFLCICRAHRLFIDYIVRLHGEWRPDDGAVFRPCGLVFDDDLDGQPGTVRPNRCLFLPYIRTVSGVGSLWMTSAPRCPVVTSAGSTRPTSRRILWNAPPGSGSDVRSGVAVVRSSIGTRRRSGRTGASEPVDACENYIGMRIGFELVWDCLGYNASTGV